MHDDDFYVGYLPVPPRLRRRTTRTAAALVAGAAIAAGALAVAQGPFAASRFEFGNVRAITGTIFEKPAPLLVSGHATYLLVGKGKHGAAVAGLNGRAANVRGTKIERDGLRMLELAERPSPLGDRSESPIQPVPLGEVRLRGEIVDSKCWSGVMNPGDGKVHRACASLCIRGGIPPMFITRDRSGATAKLLLTGAGDVLEYVAEPVEIEGTVSRSGKLLVLEPRSIRRLAAISESESPHR